MAIGSNRVFRFISEHYWGDKVMARPIKWRRVCSLPESNKFGPLDSALVDGRECINMKVDEYETIRLIDLEGLTQEECAIQMDIARTTVQGIYMRARKKLAESLINCKVLVVEGGKYQLCNGHGQRCGHNCRMYRHGHGLGFTHKKDKNE